MTIKELSKFDEIIICGTNEVGVVNEINLDTNQICVILNKEPHVKTWFRISDIDLVTNNE